MIAVVSLVQGMSESIKGQFAEIGGSTLTLRPENDEDNWRTGKLNNITVADIEALRHRVAGVGQVAPMLQVQPARAGYKGRTTLPEVYGATSEFQAVRARYPERGRFIVAADDVSRRRVAVIGTKLRDDRKMPKEPIGEYFMLGGEWFKVVGVMEPQGGIFGFSQDNYAAIPFDVARGMSGYANEPMMTASFTVTRMEEIEAVRERVRRALRANRRLEAKAEDPFTVEAADSFVRQFEKVTATITAVVARIVGISLLVGGIGIMNIMLVSVTERTREIGILKALGATRRDIMIQFLLEAALLALLGGVVGIVLGYAAGAGIAALIPDFPPASVPLWIVVVAAGFSALVGVVFGLMAASKAASLDPIDALRYE